jgi:hypothetical protein
MLHKPETVIAMKALVNALSEGERVEFCGPTSGQWWVILIDASNNEYTLCEMDSEAMSVEHLITKAALWARLDQ